MANPDTNRPLKVQVGIRDHWVKEDGPLQKAIKDLEALLGHDVVVEPEWNLLIAELDDFYEDKGNLVAVIADCVQVWIKSMMELLEDPANESWTDTVLEKVPVRLRVIVEVAPSDKASSSWSEQRSAFVVSLPKKQVYRAAALFPTFRGDLLACFDSNKKPQLPDKTAGAADDWAGVEVDGETGKPLVVDHPKSARPAARPKTEFLPSVASMPRPDLLLTQPPYHLTMHEGNRHIELQCSHSPSLQFLSDYLKRWCRINHHDTSNPPAVQIILHQSAFGMGEMFDRLVLSTQETRYTSQFQVTAPMLVALIEGTLGYDLVSTYSGWTFRRDTEFKTL
ncbi:hypothetical protein N656DRAFT_811520 [Canariomyces notabilis]|uniref:Uncharacterized protein n=1 Tax=Canariomyces notabilis TaxID=2074819 RepID=A0AAN6TLC1_9PEZI|nr:hypothetical protein N656DRAFT_811520 [Canariomyces arenarius]